MKNNLIHLVALLAGVFLVGCGSSSNIPTRQESQKIISTITPLLDSLTEEINIQTQNLPSGYDLIYRTRMSAINTLLQRVVNRSLADIHIDFLSTQPVWKEEQSIFGIGHTNFINVDTGKMDIDLRKFYFTSMSTNLIDSEIEIEGTGMIRISGKYTGLSATASPQIRFYLNEQIQFSISTADSDYIRLHPIPKQVTLKAKATISLLGWNVPFYKEIPLLTTDLIKPVLIPSALRSEIVFPIPAAQYGNQRLDFVKRYLRFTRSTVRVHENILEYRSDIDFEKE